MDIHYPDTLIQIWRYLHDELPAPNESEIADAFEFIRTFLCKCLFNKDLYDLNDRQKVLDAATDFLCQLMKGSCPEHILSSSVLISEAKKFLAKRNNPVQYELNDILHEALLALEKDGEIRRDAASRGRRIGERTLFVLSSISSPGWAHMEDYAAKKAEIPRFTTKIRAGDAGASRILSPGDAKILVRSLLYAFGGWTTLPDLLRAMQNHVPEQLTVVPPNDFLENIPADDDDFIYDFDRRQAGMLVAEAVSKIWQRVCQISDTVFCLYFLPKNFLNGKVKSADFGAPSTVSNQNAKIRAIIADELSGFQDYPESFSHESVTVRATIREIFQNLCGKCMETGKDPGLYGCEANI